MRTVVRRLAVLTIACAAGACSSEPSAQVAADAPDAGDDGSDGGLAIAIGPIALQPGEEITYCVVKRLPIADPVEVARIASTLSPGSHHLILYRTTDHAEHPEPYECQPFVNIGTYTSLPIYMAGTASADLRMPAGTSYQLGPNDLYMIEAHYINSTPVPIQARGVVRFYPYAAGALILSRATIFLYGTSAIDLPAGATASSQPFFARPPEGSSVFALSTHTHRLGIDSKVAVSQGLLDPGNVVYGSLSWDAPPLKQFDPPLVIRGWDGLRLDCQYRNTTDHRVRFGFSAGDEMCMVFGMYSPSLGSLDVCIGGLTIACDAAFHPDGTVIASSLAGPGNLALDATALYFTDEHRILKLPLSGGPPLVLADVRALPTGLAIDEEFVYWISRYDSNIWKAPLRGGEPTVVASDEWGGATSLAIDDTSVYWTNEDRGEVRRADKRGRRSPTTVASRQSGPASLAVTRSHLYWLNRYSGTITQANLDGSGVVTRYWNNGGIFGAFTADEHNLYWATYAKGSYYHVAVVKLPHDSAAAPVELANDFLMIDDIVSDGQDVYFTGVEDDPRSWHLQAPAVWRVPIDGRTAPVKIASDPAWYRGGHAIAVGRTRVYWSNASAGTILEADK